ncbi:MAG: radical SAM protein [Bacilli bacterium]|nr:radical SAM protein [Bacilli bacterium]
MRFQKFKSIFTNNNCNPYRGCEHDCIYCDARSKVYHIDGEFTDIIVKENAVALARSELARKRQKAMIHTGAMCDPYTISESKTLLTRNLLEVIYEFGFGVGILTKSTLILRDLDVLQKINERYKTIVCFTITNIDDEICKKIEPRSSLTSARFAALQKFHDAHITTGVWLCPTLPFINDSEENIRSIVRKCGEVGVSYIIVFEFGTTMREGSREYFYNCLDREFPGLKEKYQKKYGLQYNCLASNSQKLWEIFKQECNNFNIKYEWEDIKKIWEVKDTFSQISLFE